MIVVLITNVPVYLLPDLLTICYSPLLISLMFMTLFIEVVLENQRLVKTKVIIVPAMLLGKWNTNIIILFANKIY